MKQNRTKILTSVQRGVSVLRDDISSALIFIQRKLNEKNELLEKFLSIEVKIKEILERSKEDDLSVLTSEQSNLLELINVIEYDIAGKKDYIRVQTGKDFILLIESDLSQHNHIKDGIKKSIQDSVERIKKISHLKKINMELLVNHAEDLSRQVKELEIMNKLTIIPPKDLKYS